MMPSDRSCVTMGDPSGSGSEIVAKAPPTRRPQARAPFVLGDAG